MQQPTPNGSSMPGTTGVETTYDPLQGPTETPGWFPKLPRDRPGTALVLVRDGQPVQVVWPSGGGAADTGPPPRGRVRSFYEVDISDHHLELAAELPSRGDAHRFQARLHFTCTVRSPEEIVRRLVRDAGATLRPVLHEAMRRVSRRHEIADSAGAEQAVRAELLHLEQGEGFDRAFRLRRMSISLDLDATGVKHADEWRQQRHQRDIDDDQADGQIKRSERYRSLVEEGEWGMVRLALGQNPGHLPKVLQAMRDGTNNRFQNNLQALRFLVENGIVGPEDLQGIGELMGTDLTRLLRQPRVLPSARPPKPDPDDG